MHTIIICSIIAVVALLVFRFSSRAELLSFFIFFFATAIVLVSLIVIEEYKMAMIPAGVLLIAVFRMRQSYKRFQS